MNFETAPIYSYTDYRSFLKDSIDQKIKKNPQMSLRSLSARAGFSSPGYCQMVFRGERNLTAQSTDQFIKLLELKGREAEYFKSLVDFNQAKILEKKKSALFELQKLIPKQSETKSKLMSIHERWYNLAILELASCKDFSFNVTQVVKAFNGMLTKVEVKEALAGLEKKGLIEKTESGFRLLYTDHILSTVEIDNIFIREFHRKTMDLAKDSLSLPLEEREFQNVVFALSPERFEIVKKKIDEFRKELSEFCQNDGNANRVYHIQIQAYPVAVSSIVKQEKL